MDQYNEKLLAVKIYWDNNDSKKEYNIFADKLKSLDKIKEEKGLHEYDNKKQILYLRTDMQKLEKYENKYYRITKFYKDKLVELGDMKNLKNSYKKDDSKKYSVVKWTRKVNENEAAC